MAACRAALGAPLRQQQKPGSDADWSHAVLAQAGATYRINSFATLRSKNSVLLPTRAFCYRRQSERADTLQDVGYRQREVDTRQELRFARPKLQTMLTFS